MNECKQVEQIDEVYARQQPANQLFDVDVRQARREALMIAMELYRDTKDHQLIMRAAKEFLSFIEMGDV